MELMTILSNVFKVICSLVVYFGWMKIAEYAYNGIAEMEGHKQALIYVSLLYTPFAFLNSIYVGVVWCIIIFIIYVSRVWKEGD